MKLSKKISKIIALASIGIITTLSLAGCTAGKKQGLSDSPKEVKFGYVNWSDGIALTNVAKVVLEEKMGYDVKLTEANAGIVFTSVAEGDYDAFLNAWFPNAHKSYLDRYKDKLEDLGPNYEESIIGLAVPSYVGIDSIEDLKGNEGNFGGKIIGIDAGAGIMGNAERAISEYGLNIELMEGSEATMTAMLKEAIEKKEPILVTGWRPHWKFSKWDLKFLEDEKSVFGEGENIHTVTRPNFEKDMPEVAQFLRNFKMTDTQLEGLMRTIYEGDKGALEYSREWVHENEELVNSWIPEK
jgi:glycine betaine/proline transport system substrate-binding protein